MYNLSGSYDAGRHGLPRDFQAYDTYTLTLTLTLTLPLPLALTLTLTLTQP